MEKINLSTIFITHDIDEAILLSNRIYIMTGSPGQIKDEIVIDRPRNDRREFNLTQEFLTCKKNVLRALESR
jgi:ABC-type nitrate/sulfonate/bicarbonate transport system ATPase subunit